MAEAKMGKGAVSMYCYELRDIITKRIVNWKSYGYCYYKDADGNLIAVDNVETNDDGDIILSKK